MIRMELSVKGVAVLVVAAMSLWLAIRLWPVLLLLIVSLMFATALLPFVEALVRRGASRGLAVVAVALIALAVVAILGLVIAPVVIEQTRALIDRLPELRERTVRFLTERGATDMARQVQQYDPTEVLNASLLADTGRRALNVITSTITILVLTAYILFDARRIERFVYFSTPAQYHVHVRNLLAALQRVVGGYIRGQLLTSLFITIYTFVVLAILGIPNALALAVLAGIADLIPMIGVFIAVGPATLAALSQSLPKAIIVAALLMGYQEFENRILVQRVYGATLRLPAVAVLLALLVGAELLGVAGALLSLPAAAAVRVFIEYGNDVRRGRVPPMDTAQLFAPDDGASMVSARER